MYVENTTHLLDYKQPTRIMVKHNMTFLKVLRNPKHKRSKVLVFLLVILSVIVLTGKSPDGITLIFSYLQVKTLKIFHPIFALSCLFKVILFSYRNIGELLVCVRITKVFYCVQWNTSPTLLDLNKGFATEWTN